MCSLADSRNLPVRQMEKTPAGANHWQPAGDSFRKGFVFLGPGNDLPAPETHWADSKPLAMDPQESSEARPLSTQAAERLKGLLQESRAPCTLARPRESLQCRPKALRPGASPSTRSKALQQVQDPCTASRRCTRPGSESKRLSPVLAGLPLLRAQAMFSRPPKAVQLPNKCATRESLRVRPRGLPSASLPGVVAVVRSGPPGGAASCPT
jgi:hypothetical protein